MVDPDDLEEDLEYEDQQAGADDHHRSQDPSLTLFLRRPPAGADHVVVLASTTTGDQVIQDRDAREATADAHQLAELVLDACGRWATAEGRRTRFRLCWQHGERILASHQLIAGEGDPGSLDGSVNSFLMQQQRHAETTHRLSHDGFQMVQSSWEKLQRASMARIEALERDNAELRERLRKAGDVEAEIAYSTVAANIEQRQRTTEILESRLMPILQQVIMSKLGIGGGGESNGAAALAELLQKSLTAAASPEEPTPPSNSSSSS